MACCCSRAGRSQARPAWALQGGPWPEATKTATHALLDWIEALRLIGVCAACIIRSFLGRSALLKWLLQAVRGGQVDNGMRLLSHRHLASLVHALRLTQNVTCLHCKEGASHVIRAV